MLPCVDVGARLQIQRTHLKLPCRVVFQDSSIPCRVVFEDSVASCDLRRATLTEDGAIWTCGPGDDGRLGHGDVQDRLRPTRLGPEAFGGLPVVLVRGLPLGSHDGNGRRGLRLDVWHQRLRPCRPRRQDRQASVYAGGHFSGASIAARCPINCAGPCAKQSRRSTKWKKCGRLSWSNV